MEIWILYGMDDGGGGEVNELFGCVWRTLDYMALEAWRGGFNGLLDVIY